MEVLYILLALLLVVGLFVFFLYNTLVRAKTKVEEAWSQIDVQLKRRADLIPNLVETVKGYAKHEKGVFENVTKARSAILSAKTVKEYGEADNMFTSAIKSLFAVAENYPDLKASQNFQDLQEKLSGTEDKISYARQFYNGNVRDYNITIKSFPNVLLASVLGFGPSEFFEAGAEERETPEVKF